MAKFAKSTQGVDGPALTVNEEGHVAVAMALKERLVSEVLTSFVGEGKFYQDTTARLVEDCRAALAIEPQFVARLALYARTVFNLRSVSHVLSAELSNAVRGSTWVKFVLRDVCLRPDDMVEIAACYMQTHGRKLPKAMQAGLALAFNKFSAYQLAKYNRADQRPTLVDVLRMTHPQAVDERQNETFRQLRQGELPTPVTWETELSARGNKKEVWEELIAGDSLGYMALLRNLRSIVNAGVSGEALDAVAARLANAEFVRRSRVLPFRFLAAWMNLPEGAGSKILGALEEAAALSVRNLPEIPGRTLVAIDVSGSMSSNISAKSDLQCVNAAAMLGILASRLCSDCVVVAFESKLTELRISPASGILGQASSLKTSGGTAMHLTFDYALRQARVFDRIIVLSDNQVNGSAKLIQTWADEYRKRKNRDLWVHAIDMQGYGSQQFYGERTNIMAGWSEKVLEYILLRERGAGSLLQAIEAVSLENSAPSGGDPQED